MSELSIGRKETSGVEWRKWSKEGKIGNVWEVKKKEAVWVKKGERG